MKTRLIFLLITIISLNVAAQTDTIFTNSEKISCSVKELTQDAVKFIYPGEEMINTVYKSTVQKIIFRSGRVQTFAEATSYKTVSGAEDFENVTLTLIQNETNGLFKVGDVSSKARGTTGLASMEKVKERADRKMKIVAAMMGGNIVYLTQNLTLPAVGNQTTTTNLAGVAYNNKLPNYDNFVKLIADKKIFRTYERIKLSGSDSDFDKNAFSKNVRLLKIFNESGLIMMNAEMEGVDNTSFRVINYTSEEFTLVWKDGDKIYNFRIKV
jgi:hypothetical protein